METIFIVILVLFVLWLYSYKKFRRRYAIDKMMCAYIHERYQLNPCPKTAIEYASALMQCQLYYSSLILFEEIKKNDLFKEYSFLDANIAFCKNPLPWSRGAINHNNGSWRHNFLLVRFGRARRVAISEETALEFNSMLRMLNR